jgi:uncharacterized lipoprotein YmbA
MNTFLNGTRRLALAGLYLGLVVMVSGCMRSKPSRFYTLHPVLEQVNPPREAKTVGSGVIIVGVGPVRIPGYMTRGQIVTRLDRNEVKLSEFDRWADTVAERIPAIIEANLGALLPKGEVREYRVHRHVKFTHQLVVDIGDFIGAPGGDAILEAEWYLIDLSKDEPEAAARVGSYRRSIKGKTHNDVVSAMSLLLGDLAEDIAKDLTVSE